MTTTVWVIAVVLWLVWWLFFAVTERWLRIGGRPVAFGVRSPLAWVVAALPLVAAALALATANSLWVWVTCALVLLPYYAVTRMAIARLAGRRGSPGHATRTPPDHSG